MQSLSPLSYEVIVVDDCSTDSTVECVTAYTTDVSLTLLQNTENSGPAVSRNKGAQAAQGELLVFIQDDIFAENTLLEEHLAAHVTLQNEKAVVVGYTYWHPDLVMTPFLQYLDKGQQFDFDRLLARDEMYPQADYLSFYTPNVSMKLEYFMALGGFDEDFHYPGVAAYEDTELGWRLYKDGALIVLNLRARAGHFHQRTIASMMGRRYAEGMLSVLMLAKHPGFSWRGDGHTWWYVVSRLKFGVLFDRVRLPFVILSKLFLNPLLYAPLRMAAEYSETRFNVPILFKLALARPYINGWWDGYIRMKRQNGKDYA